MTPGPCRLAFAARAVGRRMGRWIRRIAGLGRRSAGRTASDYDARWRASLRAWLAYHQREVVFDRCRWMGVRVLKNPLDLWIYQELLHRVRPDRLVEIGSYEGGSTLFFAHLFDLLGHGAVISVDRDRAPFVVRHPRIVEVTGDCAAPETVAKVAELCRGHKVLLVHDGEHAREVVLRDLRLYADLVAVGSYLIVEDGIVDLFPAGGAFGRLAAGPLEAIEAFLAERPDFRPDESCERYVLTYNPRGFLRRIR